MESMGRMRDMQGMQNVQDMSNSMMDDGYAIDVEAASMMQTDEEIEEATPDPDRKPFPAAMIPVGAKKLEELSIWLDNWIDEMENAIEAKRKQWADEEKAYRAKSDGILDEPFVGASGDHVPLIAMAVDPIVARLDTGIFKTSPVFRLKALQKSTHKYIDALERFIDYYQKHKMKLRAISVPRLNELTKHGTMVFKAIYDCVEYDTVTYDANWKVITKPVVDFKGPRIVGVPISNFLFPPYHQHLQDCPIVGERLRMTWEQLKIAEASGKLTNVSKVKDQESSNILNTLEDEQATSANHRDTQFAQRYIELYEFWFDYAITGSRVQRLVCTYHRPTQTFLQLRYNWYFHQKKPYVLVPYSITNESLYGIGICEMVAPLQTALTQWQRHALNNAYLGNIRMFIAQKNSGIEQKPRLFCGRVFFVEDPAKDFIPFNAAADTYPSTLTERQNLIGLAEKRTGVSDYLTGRESPIVGSRATATSTLALINEGTKRVEEVMENIRQGYAELMEMCMSIWIQWGPGDIVDLVFGGDDVNILLTEFFDTVDKDNINGAMALELSATDAANNRTVQQQAQLAIIQTMMVYLQKVVEVGQLAVQSASTAPQLTMLIGEVMDSARSMYRELLEKYEIRNPEAYLPDLQQFLASIGAGGAANAPPPVGGVEGQFDLSALNPPTAGPPGQPV